VGGRGVRCRAMGEGGDGGEGGEQRERVRAVAGSDAAESSVATPLANVTATTAPPHHGTRPP
jgi:hypothetical protein